MKNKFKVVFQVTFVSFILIVVIDQLIAFIRPNALYPSHYNMSDYQRAPRPYIEFSGLPDVLDHNELGYRWTIDKTQITPSFKIAFFGGSTGYDGDPTIAELLAKHLRSNLGINVEVANFSVVSSNHRQHVHNIIESHKFFNPDLVIFYGGYNETAQPAFYDPRPGYPYNFFYRDETSPWSKFLLEQSPLINILNRIGVKFGWFDLTPLSQLRAKVKIFSDEWKNSVNSNYIETLKYADKVSQSFTSNLCSKEAKFRAFYQPYQIPDNLKSLDAGIRQSLKSQPYAYDVSDVFHGHENVFTDIVHVKQEGNELMAKRLFDILKSDATIFDCLKKRIP